MLVVLAVIAIVAAIVIPRVTSLAGFELNAAARNLAGTIHLVYSSAVVKKTPYRIVFDLEKQSYTIEEKAGTEYVAATDPLMAPRVLSEAIAIKKVQVADRTTIPYDKGFLYFTPGGYVEAAAVYFTTLDGAQVLTVFTEPLTGRAVIVPEEISREEWEKSEENP